LHSTFAAALKEGEVAIPLLLVTALDAPPDLARAIEAADWLAKPF
jgi:CheY-like chemotaxis protein